MKAENELSAKNLFNGTYQIFKSVPDCTPSLAAVGAFEFAKGLIDPFILMSFGEQREYWKLQMEELKGIYKDVAQGFGQ